jgi:hypothetical protein
LIVPVKKLITAINGKADGLAGLDVGVYTPTGAKATAISMLP